MWLETIVQWHNNIMWKCYAVERTSFSLSHASMHIIWIAAVPNRAYLLFLLLLLCAPVPNTCKQILISDMWCVCVCVHFCVYSMRSALCYIKSCTAISRCARSYKYLTIIEVKRPRFTIQNRTHFYNFIAILTKKII